MVILVDENVPYGREAFGLLGEVRTAHGRKISREMLADADALVVRSITKVTRELLDGTPVRFVGTCTIGEDHVDKAWLAAQGITFSSAPGCNANSVGEYITAALLHLAERHGLTLAGMKLGIVGVGNVGRRVWKKAEALGVRCVLNDPPRFDTEGGDAAFRPIEEILDCDIITFHVPIEKTGPHATWHLADAAFLSQLKPGAIVINSSRGPVVDNQALKAALRSGSLRAAVLDVWEGEPQVDTELLGLVDIATPHIAGYSFDGKVNGTRQVYEALCASLHRPAEWDPSPLLPAPDCAQLVIDPAQTGALSGAVRAVYEIMSDDARMREMLALSAPEEQSAWFDRLRKEYPRRREFFNTRVTFAGPDAALEQLFSGVGFQCA
jgi:erythronate-4-phosphate dehydrogenase